MEALFCPEVEHWLVCLQVSSTTALTDSGFPASCCAGDVGRCEVSDCTITSNKLNGILVKDGAELTVSASDVCANGGYGVQLSDCTAVLQLNTIARNRQGSVAAELGTVTFDEKQLRAENMLSDELVLL